MELSQKKNTDTCPADQNRAPDSKTEVLLINMHENTSIYCYDSVYKEHM